MGVHANTSHFPEVVKTTCRFIKQFSHGAPFSSFIFLDQALSALHKDAYNEPASWNLILPLSSFSEGGVWYECQDGDVPCPHDESKKGRILQVSQGPQWLSATTDLHCTLPWKGRRCVLVAYTTRFLHSLAAKDVCFLSDCGFNLQESQTTGGKRASPVSPLLPAQPRALNDFLVVELCCGGASLSWACHKQGFQTLPVDHRQVSSRMRSIQLDLACPSVVDSLCKLLRHEAPRIALIWAGVPCGTASRAREKPLPGLEAKGFRIPKPLRSESHPDGLPGLTGVDKQKTEMANQVYDAVTVLMSTACELHVPCVIENPFRSHYWGTSFFKSLQLRFPGQWIDFHACQHQTQTYGAVDKSRGCFPVNLDCTLPWCF